MEDNRKIMPLVPLRGLVAFPNVVLHFDAGRDKTMQALQEVMASDQICFLSAQKDMGRTDLAQGDIHEFGTVARVKQMLKLPGDSMRVLVEGMHRGRIECYVDNPAYFEVEIQEFLEDELETDLSEAMSRKLIKGYEKYMRSAGKSSGEVLFSMMADGSLGRLCDIIAASTLVKLEDKQHIIEQIDPILRAQALLEILQRESEIHRLEGRIQQQVKQSIEKSQKEYFLREQIRVIRRELGDEESAEAEQDELREKLEALPLPEEVRTKAMKELSRLRTLPANSHETPGIQNYLEWITELPWGTYTQDNLDIHNARRVLDEDHYSMEQVKDRIIEHLAICNLKEDVTGTILCFVGPPGVGKTSIAASIARAVGRNFVRMSLGGVRDEAEIRGHRRTYIGSMPGRIVSALKQAKSMNPVLLFDEIDKLSHDYRGDPASAMLEVLDGEQNHAFRDHFLEVPVDLSKVMFITTANSKDTIPRPLLDRMEVIELSSYTEQEKVEICMRHLLGKQLKKNGLKSGAVRIRRDMVGRVVNEYTREAGVRNLERRMGDICRKVACEVLQGRKSVTVNGKRLVEYLGAPKYKQGNHAKEPKVGTAVGLAWTSVGGSILEIEVAAMQGKGKLELTGQLGDVMKESAQAGFSYVRAHAQVLGINPSFYEDTDIHIHIPEGAVPKDGPSAGITLAVAMISALNGIAVRQDIAMTGEVSLHGRVLPVGGLKEKLLAAQRMGITEAILPAENRPNIEELPEIVTKDLRIHYVETLEEVLTFALTKKPVKYIAFDAVELPVVPVDRGMQS